MKIALITARIIFVICFPILLFTAAIGIAFNSRWLYQYGFNKYDISAVTGISPAELNKAAGGLVRYWNSGEKYIDLTVLKDGQPFTLFNEREIVHLKDVKALVWLDYRSLLFAGLYCLVYATFALWWRRPCFSRELAVASFAGSLASLGLLAVLGVMALTDFNGFWWQFHIISFSNDFWLLDPSRDYLIMMFPEGFWFDSVLVVASLAFSFALLIGAFSLFKVRRYGAQGK